MMSLRQNEEEKKQWEEEKRMAGLKYKDEKFIESVRTQSGPV